MAFISRVTIQEVNDRLDALAVVGDYVRLEKKGGRYWGLCPFHNEKTPSFTVDPGRKMYHCFGCGQGGGIITFIMEMDKLTFPEAVETLARRFGIEIVYEHDGYEVPAGDGGKKNAEEAAELYRRVTVSFHHMLLERPEGKRALDYVESRKISRETMDRFRLGFSPPDRYWLFQFLSKKGYSEEFLAASGLFSERYPRSSFFSGRLMFPIVDRNGNTVAFGGRVVPSPPDEHSPSGEGGAREEPKYINSRESPWYKKRETLFAVDLAIPEIRKTKEAYLCEGYMDVIALHEAGIRNAVAPLGTAFTDEQAKLLRRWAERLNLVFDSDDAGRAAAVKAVLTARRNGLPCFVVAPGGRDAGPAAPNDTAGPKDPAAPKDPADILQLFGPQTLQKSMKCFINDLEYLLARGRSIFDVSNPEGKARAVAFLFPYLEALDSDVSRDDCFTAAAEAFGAEKAAVQRDYERRRLDTPRRGQDASPRGEGGAQSEKPVVMNDELFLLAVVAFNFHRYPEFRAALSIKEIEDPAAKELFVAMEECFVNEESGIDTLLARISSAVLRNFIAGKGVSGEFTLNPERLISDGIRRVKARRLHRRLTEIVAGIRRMRHEERESPGNRLDDLLAEKMQIDNELRQLEGK
ncbi:MAG: DNA primase [Treponema sp.]|nr:DNA primase [Treponema sp.]